MVRRPAAKNAPNNFNVNKVTSMTLTVSTGPVIALIAGVLILVMPRLLNYIVAIYLIVIGLLGLFGSTHGVHI
jgi:uncharacterized membrane protein (Fun14 family)